MIRASTILLASRGDYRRWSTYVPTYIAIIKLGMFVRTT